MKRKKALWLAIAAALAASPFLALKIYDKFKTRSKASIACAKNPADGRARILIIGDSWAAKGRLLAGFNDRLSGTLAIGRICSVGFPGHTTKEIGEHLSTIDVDEILNGRPTHLIILSGVNDLSQNVRVSQYVRSLKAIAARFPDAKLYVVTPPIVDVATRPSNPTRLRRAITGVFGDTDRDDMVDRLEAAYPKRVLIDYDRFSLGPAIEPDRYAADMVHLTDSEYRNLGAFIGDFITP